MDIPWPVYVIPLVFGLLLYIFLLCLKWRQDKKWGKMSRKTTAEWCSNEGKRQSIIRDDDIGRHWRKRMDNSLLLLAVFSLASCTAVYGPDGKKRFQTWDAQGLAYSQTPEGAVSLQATSVAASQTILAIGKAATPAVMAMGAVAAMNATTQTVKAVRAPLLPR